MIKPRIVKSQKTQLNQHGSVLVEFALSAPLLFLVIFAVIEFSRIFYDFNLANEATRFGARLATVCSINAPGIKTQMKSRFPLLDDGNININYHDQLGNGCNQSTCATVTVDISNVSVQTYIPFFPLQVNLPSFSTTLPRESLNSGNGNDANDLCI